MATYLPGITDYIPQIQPFKPNLNLYATVLQTKQSQHEAALSKVSNLYGKLLYSPLSGPDNIKRRDDYFKMIEQDIKKISSMDLTLPQNQTIAENIFKPLIEDKHLAKDWAFTKQLHSQIQYGESFKDCKKPEDCGGSWWQGGMTFLYEKQKEFVEASPEERLKMQAPSYVPYQDVNKILWEWASKQNNNTGLTVTAAYSNGKYIIKKQNGQEMLPTLQAVFTSLVANDPKIAEMYKVKAYLYNKEGIEKELPFNNNDKDKAESSWYNKIITETGKRLLEMQKESEDLKNQVGAKKGVINEAIKKEGVVRGPGAIEDPLLKEYMGITEEEEIADANYTYFSDIKSLMENIDQDVNNRKLLAEKILSITANGFMMEDIQNISTQYASAHNAITGIEKDPYYYQYMNHKYAMQRMGAEADLDLRNKLILESVKGAGQALTNLWLTGGDDSPKFTNGVNGNNAGQSSPAFPAEGAADLLKESVEARAKGYQESQTSQNKLVVAFVNQLDGIINNPNSNEKVRQYAIGLKADVFGKEYYDPKTNQYINGSTRSSNFYDMGYDNQKMFKFYNAANPTILKNSSLKLFDMKTFYDLQEDVDRERSLYVAANENIKFNTTLVRSALDSSADPEVIKARPMLNNLFVRESNNQYNIKDINTYIKDYVNSLPEPGPGVNRKEYYNNASKKAKSDYFEAYGVFKKVYHSTQGIKPLPGRTLINGGADGGRTAGRTAMYDFDQALPFAAGTEGFKSFMQLYQNLAPGSYKLVGPTMIYDGGILSSEKLIPTTSLTADQLKETQTEQNAQLLLKTLNEDFRQVYKEGNFNKRPFGKLYRSDIAANNANMVSYTFMPSSEWLRKYAVKNKSGNITVFGYDINNLSANGITMYMNKKDDVSSLGKEFAMQPFDALVMQGIPLSISRPNTGNVVLERKGDRVYLNGSLQQVDANNNVVNSIDFNPKEYNYFVGEGSSFSPGQMFVGVKDLVDQLFINNNNAKMGLPTMDKLYDPEMIPQLMQSIFQNAGRRYGLTEPGMQEKTIDAYKSQIRTSMEMANQLMR